MKTASVAIVLAILTGCCKDHEQQRFIPKAESGLLIDTKTGQECWPGPKEVMFKAPDHPDQPYCVDLSKQ